MLTGDALLAKVKELCHTEPSKTRIPQEQSIGRMQREMTESLHKIVKHYINHSDADDLCNDITGWLMRNYQYYQYRPTIDKICDDIWKSCQEADKV